MDDQICSHLWHRANQTTENQYRMPSHKMIYTVSIVLNLFEASTKEFELEFCFENLVFFIRSGLNAQTLVLDLKNAVVVNGSHMRLTLAIKQLIRTNFTGLKLRKTVWIDSSELDGGIFIQFQNQKEKAIFLNQYKDLLTSGYRSKQSRTRCASIVTNVSSDGRRTVNADVVVIDTDNIELEFPVVEATFGPFTCCHYVMYHSYSTICRDFHHKTNWSISMTKCQLWIQLQFEMRGDEWHYFCVAPDEQSESIDHINPYWIRQLIRRDRTLDPELHFDRMAFVEMVAKEEIEDQLETILEPFTQLNWHQLANVVAVEYHVSNLFLIMSMFEWLRVKKYSFVLLVPGQQVQVYGLGEEKPQPPIKNILQRMKSIRKRGRQDQSKQREFRASEPNLAVEINSDSEFVPLAQSKSVETFSLSDRDRSLFGHYIQLNNSIGTPYQCVMNCLVTLYFNGTLAEGIFRMSTAVRCCEKLKNRLELEYRKESVEKRVPPVARSHQSLEERFGQTILEEYSIFEVANTIKMLIKSIPDSLLSGNSYDEWLAISEQISKLKEMEDFYFGRISCCNQISGLLGRSAKGFDLNQGNIHFLRYFVSLLYQISCVAEHRTMNKMSAKNLGICIAPIMLRRPVATRKVSFYRSLRRRKAHRNESIKNELLACGKVAGLIEFIIVNCDEIFGANTSELMRMYSVLHFYNMQSEINYCPGLNPHCRTFGMGEAERGREEKLQRLCRFIRDMFYVDISEENDFCLMDSLTSNERKNVTITREILEKYATLMEENLDNGGLVEKSVNEQPQTISMVQARIHYFEQQNACESSGKCFDSIGQLRRPSSARSLNIEDHLFEESKHNYPAEL